MALAQELRTVIADVKNEKYVVYKIINITNNKVYIGKTVRSIRDRFSGHNHKIRRGSQLPIYNAIRYYGWSNFRVEVLERCSSLEDLNNAEISWIERLNARDKQFGYNVATGGDSGFPFSEKILKSLASSRKGKPLSEEHKRKISEGSVGAQLGKVVSEATRKLLSVQLTGVPKWNKEQKAKMSSDMTGSGNHNYKAISKDQILECFRQSKTLSQMEDILGIDNTTITRKVRELFGLTTEELRKSLGAKKGNEKLSEKDVDEIRLKSSQGTKNVILAKEYGVSASLIGLIVNRKTRVK